VPEELPEELPEKSVKPPTVESPRQSSIIVWQSSFPPSGKMEIGIERVLADARALSFLGTGARAWKRLESSGDIPYRSGAKSFIGETLRKKDGGGGYSGRYLDRGQVRESGR
jgi:hypothetical protein